MTYHFCNLEMYMKSDDVDISETNAEILLECFAFLLTVKEEILGEPRVDFANSNLHIIDMWAITHAHLSAFLEDAE